MENSYSKLRMTLIISIILMYVIMFLKINEVSITHLNQIKYYISILLGSSITLLILFTMRQIFKKKFLDIFIVAINIIIFATPLFFLRTQISICNKQYMKSILIHMLL